MEAPTAARGINRRTPIEVNDSLKRRFWESVERRGDDECWPWIKAPRTKSKFGSYGVIRQGRKLLSSHVVSYAIHNGPVPSGMVVKHSCDNRTCCNPAHLSAGTYGSNVKEMHERGRAAIPKGTATYNAVLNDELVRKILALRIVYGIGELKIARALGIHPGAVKGVTARKSWKHVPMPTDSEALQIVAGLNLQSDPTKVATRTLSKAS